MSFYTYTPLISKALARSSSLNAEFQKVETAFGLVDVAISGIGGGASASTHTIEGAGSKTFVLTSGAFAIGQFVLFADTADPVNWMLGQVTAYDVVDDEVTATMIDSGGTGVKSAWTISLVPPGYESAYFQDIADSKADKDDGAHTGQTTFASCAGGSATTPAAFAFDCAANNFFTKTCTGAHTISFTNVPAGSWAGILVLTNGGLDVLTLPAGSTWAGGVAPTLTAAGIDILTVFTTNGGTNWRWSVQALNVS